MYLKEAFRYQNYLSGLVERTVGYLSARSYITRTTQEHLRHKANSDAEDEIVEITADRPFECTNNQLVSFLNHLMVEKETLTAAISTAKRSCSIDIDAEITNNRTRQRVASVFAEMSKQRPSESVIRGIDYKFNGEGNQVTYNYDVKQVTVIDFDRNKVRDTGRSLMSKADEVSAEIDKAMVELVVEYEPEYSVNDSFEDAVEMFVHRFNPAE